MTLRLRLKFRVTFTRRSERIRFLSLRFFICSRAIFGAEPQLIEPLEEAIAAVS